MDSEEIKVRRIWHSLHFATQWLKWLLVLVAIIGIARWLDDRRLVLDYLKVLTWPLVAGATLFWLRQPLRDKLREILKVQFPGGYAEFATKAFEHELETPSKILQKDTTHPEALSASPTQRESTAPVADISNPDRRENNPHTLYGDGVGLETARRLAIERIIEESANWGYTLAKSGFEGRPAVRIDWGADGRPQVHYNRDKSVAHFMANYDPFVKARNIEKEIRDIEKSLSRAGSVGGIAGTLAGFDSMANREHLKVLKRRLARIDPNSALLDD